MDMKCRTDPKPIKSVTWTVRGANWAFEFAGDSQDCPTEMATRAVEKAWRDDDEDWKSGRAGDEGILHATESNGGGNSIGIALEVHHDQMGNRDDHIIVPSCLALSNAGFHDEAERLRREWYKATDDDKLFALVSMLGLD